MPLRVRCRCGQELIVRHSEWVYIFLGLVLVAVLVNTAAVVLLVLNTLETRETTPATARTEAAGGEPRVVPDEDDRGTAGSSETGSTSGTSREGGNPVPGQKPFPDPGRAVPPAGTEDRDRTTSRPGGDEARSTNPGRPPAREPTGLSPDTPVSPRALAQRERPGAAVQNLLEQLEILTAEATASPLPEEVPAPSVQALLEAPRLLRLLMLDKAKEDLEIACACLSDPDPLIRTAAIEQVLAHPSLENAPLAATSKTLGSLLQASRRYLVGDPAGQRILEIFQLDASAEESTEFSQANWARLRERASALAAGTPGREALENRLEIFGDRGADFLFTVDTTRSMDKALENFKQTASWLLPALEWSVPGARVGFLAYKDEVEEIAGLSSQPSREVLPRILTLRARGGGDVPEGVYGALRVALELGKFSWRTTAAKHIVIIGDQPPRYGEKRAFESLAAASHRQGGFFIHLLGVHPRDGGAEIPFFADFARAGGGRYATCDRKTLGLEALTCLFGNSNRLPMERLSPIFRRLFTNG